MAVLRVIRQAATVRKVPEWSDRGHGVPRTRRSSTVFPATPIATHEDLTMGTSWSMMCPFQRARKFRFLQGGIMRRLLALAFVALLYCAASAQLPTSTLNGTVTDPQGAAVAGAKVTAVNQATGVTRDTTTDSQGLYSFANLPPGEYSVRIESPTFAKTELKDIRLVVGRASTVDAK